MQPLSKRAVALVSLLALGMACYYFSIFVPRANLNLETASLGLGYHFGGDLYPLWLTSGQILHKRTNPYTVQTTRQIQTGLYGRALDANRPGDPPVNYRAFAYPLYADFVVIPFASLPFPIVRAFASLCFPIILIGGCWLWSRFLNFRIHPQRLACLFLLTLTSYPALEGLYALQPTVIITALLAGSATALVRGRLALAGALLALASVKPQLVIIVALWLLWWSASDFARRRNFAISFAATLSLLMLIANLVIPGATVCWIHSLSDYRHYTDPALPQFVLGKVAGNFFCILLACFAIALSARARKSASDSPQFAATFAILLAITVLTVPSSLAVYEHLLLFPAILWLLPRKDQFLQHGAALRIIGYLSVAALFWQWIAASGLVLWSVMSPQVKNTTWSLLPLRTAAAIPFEVVALGLLLMWKPKKAEISMPARSVTPSG